MRLRPLTEAECYARCYGGRQFEVLDVVRPLAPEPSDGGARDRIRTPLERALASEVARGLEAA